MPERPKGAARHSTLERTLQFFVCKKQIIFTLIVRASRISHVGYPEIVLESHISIHIPCRRGVSPCHFLFKLPTQSYIISECCPLKSCPYNEFRHGAGPQSPELDSRTVTPRVLYPFHSPCREGGQMPLVRLPSHRSD